MSNNNSVHSNSKDTFGNCRPTKCTTLNSGAATMNLAANNLVQGTSERSVILELVVNDPTVKRPVHNRRNRVVVVNTNDEVVAKADVSISAITNSEGAVTGYKLVSQAIKLPASAGTYNLQWYFVAATPTHKYVQTNEPLTITALAGQ